MIIPSIDLRRGRAVQLREGREHVLDGGDPMPWLDRFARVGEVAVIDLDGALGEGNNEALIRSMLERARCRVGGGIRDAATARNWLDRGAKKIILGTRAEPALLRELPRERVVVALDARDEEVVVDGWRRGTGQTLWDRLRDLAPLAGGFLVTVVQNEGRMTGVDLEWAKRVAEAAAPARLTLAGGVRSVEEIAALDALGIDAQVGMALYTGALDCAGALAACLSSDRADGLWPTVVADERGVALGLAWSDAESLREALDTGAGVYRSRTRGLWKKGLESGATQELLRVDLDCDRDALRFTVRQRGTGFCHQTTRTCWGDNPGLRAVEDRLRDRRTTDTPESYTRRLLNNPELLRAKLREEAAELADATTAAEVAQEASDLAYFSLVALVRAGAGWSDVEEILARRMLTLSRRPGLAKTGEAS